MKRIAIGLCLLAISVCAVVAGGKRSHYGPAVKTQPGDELNLGIGATSLVSAGNHLHLDLRLISNNIGLKISFGSDLDRRVIRFQSYSLGLEGMAKLSANGDWYLIGGYRWAALYASAYSSNHPITYFTGPTAGVGADVWRPGWLTHDRVSIIGQWWFSKTNSAWQVAPASPKIILTLTYFLI